MEPQVLQEWLKEIDGHEEDALADILHKEIQKWSQNCVDVEALQRRVSRSEETCRILSKKITILQSQLQKLQLEKINNYNSQERSKIIDKKNNQKHSSNAEDEGISSSERSSSPEELKHRQTNECVQMQDNDQETTIDDVIEELRIIVKDAEEEFEDRNQTNLNQLTKVNIQNSLKKDEKKSTSIEIKNSNPKKNQVTYFGSDKSERIISRKTSSQDFGDISKSSNDRGVKIVVRGPDVEEAIVPAILHPQPPRRTASCLSVMLAVRNCDLVDDHEVYNSHDEEIEEETLGDGSDSLLSASRLKYNDGKINSNNNFDERVGNIAIVDQMKVNENFEILRETRTNSASDKSIIIGNHLESKSISKKNNNNSGGQQQNHRHRSEVEKKKFLRRATSHDFLESNNSSPHSRRSGSRIEGKIRKFESLNSFDERQSLQNFSRFMDGNLRYISIFLVIKYLFICLLFFP